MSLDATVWAWSQQVKSSSAKLVLLALADRAGSDFTAWPSIETISSETELDRKTVISAIQKLTVLGLVSDTGERKGFTGHVKVYRLIGITDRAHKRVARTNSTKNGTVPDLDVNSTENGTLNSTENGTQNLSLNQSENGNKKSVSKKLTFPQWAVMKKEAGEKLIADYKPFFEFCDLVKLPEDFAHLAWFAFCQYYSNDNLKKYSDWRRHCVTALRDDYLKLWQINRDGEYYLTTKGKQIQSLMEVSK